MTAAEINALIDAKQAAGGGTVELPAGTHTLEATSGSLSVVMKSGVKLFGADRDACVLRVDDGADAHGISIKDVEDAGVENLTVDGNRTAQTANTHGIRLEGVTRATLRGVTVLRSRGYGIGYEGGVIAYCVNEDIWTEDTGLDGFDTKNLDDGNVGNVVRNLTVNGYDKQETGGKAGIDFRGPWTASNITIIGVKGGFGGGPNVGIRWRQGELGDPSGYGGHDSTLSAFSVTGDGSGGYGLQCLARRVIARNGTVSGLSKGVYVVEEDFLGEDIAASSCTTGFEAGSTGSPLFGNDATFRRCSATSSGTRDFYANGQARTIMEQCTGGVEVASGSTDCVWVGPAVTPTGAGSLAVNYTGTDADLLAELVSAGFTPLSAQLGIDNAQRILARARFNSREGQGTMWYEIAPAAALSTLAAPMAAAYNALR